MGKIMLTIGEWYDAVAVKLQEHGIWFEADGCSVLVEVVDVDKEVHGKGRQIPDLYQVGEHGRVKILSHISAGARDYYKATMFDGSPTDVLACAYYVRIGKQSP